MLSWSLRQLLDLTNDRTRLLFLQDKTIQISEIKFVSIISLFDQNSVNVGRSSNCIFVVLIYFMTSASGDRNEKINLGKISFAKSGFKSISLYFLGKGPERPLGILSYVSDKHKTLYNIKIIIRNLHIFVIKEALFSSSIDVNGPSCFLETPKHPCLNII